MSSSDKKELRIWDILSEKSISIFRSYVQRKENFEKFLLVAVIVEKANLWKVILSGKGGFSRLEC